MILPAKHLKQERSLIGIGQEILMHINEQLTVSELWERVKNERAGRALPISFDWFVLALSFMFTINAVEIVNGIITLRQHDDS